MKYLFFTGLIMVALLSCRKKDTYGYTCSCKDKASGKTDTSYTIRVPTSGEANYLCMDYRDTANVHGKNIECDLK